MDSRNTEFLALIDRAIAVAGDHSGGLDGHRAQQLLAVLQTLKQHIQSGQLEPSGGLLSLGLSRELADAVDSLAAPVLHAVGEIERFYRDDFQE
jgi:hypothetical protein